MELRQYLSVFWKWSWLIVISVLIAGATSFYASRSATPVYRTKTTLMVGTVTQNPDPTTADFYTGQQLAQTYAQLSRREPVLRAAVESLGWEIPWEAIRGQVSASQVPQTQLLEISVIDNDPLRAKVLADTIAHQLIQISPSGNRQVSNDQVQFINLQIDDLTTKITLAREERDQLKKDLDAANSARLIQDLQNQINILDTKISGWQNTHAEYLKTLQGGDINVLSIIEEAAIPATPISPNVKMNVLLAAVIGFILSAGGVVLIEYLDDTIKRAEDVTKATGLPVVGKIGRLSGKEYQDQLVALHQPESPEVEAFRVLAVKLRPMLRNGEPKSILITSPSPREGKTIVTANLAVILAQSGLRVILVDADFRYPKMHLLFGLPNKVGLRDAILCLEPGGKEHLHKKQDSHSIFLSAERPVQNQPRPTGSTRVKNLLSEMKTLPDVEMPDQKIKNEAGPIAVAVKDYLQETQVSRLSLLTSGISKENPSVLLGSRRMKYLLAELKTLADIVIIDSPPALLVADTGVLGLIVDSVVMINDTGRTRVQEMKRAVEGLSQMNVKIAGVILNRQKEGNTGKYGYYYYYSNNGKSNPEIQEKEKKALSEVREEKGSPS